MTEERLAEIRTVSEAVFSPSRIFRPLPGIDAYYECPLCEQGEVSCSEWEMEPTPYMAGLQAFGIGPDLVALERLVQMLPTALPELLAEVDLLRARQGGRE